MFVLYTCYAIVYPSLSYSTTLYVLVIIAVLCVFLSFQSIKDVDLSKLESLDFLDLSRNLIVELSPGTFAGMSNLKGLDFSVNVVRKVRRVDIPTYLSSDTTQKKLEAKKGLCFWSIGIVVQKRQIWG